MISWVRLSLFCLLLFLALPLTGGAAPDFPEALENFQYRISLGAWPEVARAQLVLKELGPGRYLAEFTGEPQGAWRLLRRWLPERYQTEMALVEGRLKPLLFREIFYNWGERVTKEYRFDYGQGRLEMWRQGGSREMVKKWQVPLKEPVYDPLTLWYNARLGAFGPLAGGETLRVPALPTPDPEDLIIHISPGTNQGRKVMIIVKENASGQERGPFFLSFSPEWAPQQGWMRVLPFGKLMGHLLDTGAAGNFAFPPFPPNGPGEKK
ncbi:MAG: hypothetical protein A2Y80_08205 [Deltaproteobacteria bacterium RBG_13_58_19]|nr:MAG: hypothetical protein A2Y80_08205 [Deltaproteobacteria bacterium RBG_13_58_19]